MKKSFLLIGLLILCAFLITACPGHPDEAEAPEPAVMPVHVPFPLFENVDFPNSPFKHINNGGITGSEVMPYNIDAITGATVTVEGTGVTASIPLSVREIQNTNDGLVRAAYTDANGQFVYEGMDLYYLLHNMTRGEKGIILTDKAYSVRLMDENRVLLADMPLADISAAHNAARPVLLAYGIGTPDLSLAAPFVYNGANPGTHSEGFIAGLGNEGGCLKLVYDPDIAASFRGGTNPDVFTSVAYIYVAEETEPGFKHITSSDPVYSSSNLIDYIITFRGDALGAEMVFTVAELEALVRTDAIGKTVPGSLGFSDYYSLANNAYWYVNEYEGLDLYKLLLYLGMDSAQEMGRAGARTTLVTFIADDGFTAPESFSVETLSYPEAFGFYRKNAIDMDDGAYIPTSADLERTGYPVLLAYGVNGYPYTISRFDGGFLSGLSNDGGPMRVVFGKTQYHHPNGSNQVKFLRNVIAGNDVLYNTHKYTDDPDRNALAATELAITVNGEDGSLLLDTVMTAGDVEDILYGDNVSASIRQSAGVKEHYVTGSAQESHSAIYEGVNLEYFLMETLGLPGTNGTVTFYGGTGESLSINLDALFRDGYNAQLGRGGIASVIAFAKNGFPLVPAVNSPGYVSSMPLFPFSEHEPAAYNVDNSGGPLAVLIAATSPGTDDSVCLEQVVRIVVDLVPDAYAHMNAPYNNYAKDTIHFSGEGLELDGNLTVSDIFSRQRAAKTLDFSYPDSSGALTERRYRGVALFDLLIDFGLKANAGDVLVHDAGGNVHRFSLAELRRHDFVNYVSPGKEPLFAMLAYGTGITGEDTMQGLPLVPGVPDGGYDDAYQNDGGPLMLILPQKEPGSDNVSLWVKNVAAIEVTANEIDSTGHTMSDIYSEFLDYKFTLAIRNDDSEWVREFTVAELEGMTDIIVRDTYSVLDIGECEGIDIWRLVRRFAGDVPGIDNPVSVTAFASDGYMNDLLSVFGMDAFVNGVADAEGSRKPLMIAYAINGLPLVDSESHAGYTGLAGNSGGPLRIIAETNQGASVKYATGVTVVVAGSGEIQIEN